MIRLACREDYEAIRAIYGEYMETPATFEYLLPDARAFAGRMDAIAKDYPLLVSTDEEGPVNGYAYAHRPWERAAYRWNAELSVYLSHTACGKGIGTRLYRAMLDLLRLMHVRVALGCITVPNEASLALHAKFGFREAARFAKSGFKNGAWHDVVWLSVELADDWEGEPGEIVPFPGLLANLMPEVEAVLENVNRT